MTARDVAEYLLRLSDEEANDITNLKLQKLLYYVQGFNLALNGEKLFAEPIEAWRYGPVVADLYHYYKDNGSQVILPDPNYEFSQPFTPEQKELMQEVNNIYGQYSGVKLMHLTHGERPWLEADAAGTSLINPQTMQAYFKEQLIEE